MSESEGIGSDSARLDWVSVAEVGKEEEAAIVAGFLKSQGIPAVVDSEKFHQAPVNFGDLAPISIMVPADREKQASEALGSQTVSLDGESEIDIGLGDTGLGETPVDNDA